VKYFDWSEPKNAKLKEDRGIGFEDVLAAIDEGNLLDDLRSRVRIHQRQLIIKHDNYVFVVPYVEDDEKIFLKTIYPSRKFTRKYLKEGGQK
jgi:uncharacterized DUF497 family protein